MSSHWLLRCQTAVHMGAKRQMEPRTWCLTGHCQPSLGIHLQGLPGQTPGVGQLIPGAAKTQRGWESNSQLMKLPSKDLFAYGKLPLVDFHIGILD